jgi:hypothetical protein
MESGIREGTTNGKNWTAVLVAISGADPFIEGETTTSPNTYANNAVVNKPVGTAQGDILFGIFSGRTGATDPTPTSVVWPAGWTHLGFACTAPTPGQTLSGQTAYAIGYKVAGSSEPDSYTFNWNSNYQSRYAARILRISGGSTVVSSAINKGVGDDNEDNFVATPADSVSMGGPNALLVFSSSASDVWDTPNFGTPADMQSRVMLVNESYNQIRHGQFVATQDIVVGGTPPQQYYYPHYVYGPRATV